MKFSSKRFYFGFTQTLKKSSCPWNFKFLFIHWFLIDTKIDLCTKKQSQVMAKNFLLEVVDKFPNNKKFKHAYFCGIFLFLCFFFFFLKKMVY